MITWGCQTLRGIILGPYEDGRNILCFLRHIELVFFETGISTENRRQEQRTYLTGEALNWWFCLWATRETVSSWEALKCLMLTRFSGVRRDKIVSRLSEVRWKSRVANYAAEFSSVLCKGGPLPQEQLVNIFLANLPDDIVLRMTNEGHVKFTTWEETAAALESCRI